MDAYAPQYIPPVDTSRWVIEQVEAHRTIDGDTVEIRTASGKQLVVRFYFVDTPELDQPGGLAAKEIVDAVLQKPALVAVRKGRVGRYGRALGEFFSLSSRMPVSVMLACAGYAWPTRHKNSLVSKCIANAKKKRYGVWSLRLQIAPKQWRRVRSEVKAYTLNAIVEDLTGAVQK